MKTEGDLVSSIYPCRIGGRYHIPDADDTFPVDDPRTGKVIAQVARPTSATVEQAVAQAERTFADPTSWRWDVRCRARALTRIAQTIRDHGPELADLEARQTGKRLQDASQEIAASADLFEFMGGVIRTDRTPSGRLFPGATSRVERIPTGPWGVILPFNYPAMLFAWRLAPLLAGGNTAVVKPDPRTPLTALRLCELFHDVLPAGTVNVVPGDGHVGHWLASDPRLAGVAFTGSPQVGSHVARLAASNGVRTHLELGGNCPAFVDLATCDVEPTIRRLVDAKVYNAGQSCAAPERLYVIGAKGAAQEFLSGLANELHEREPGRDYGTLIDAAAVEKFEQRCVDATATRFGVFHSLGHFVVPALAMRSQMSDAAWHEEWFGPAFKVAAFEDRHDAFADAATSPYDLAASVWSTDARFVDVATRDLRYGEVWVNTCLDQTAELPHGGIRHSGHGADMSAYSLDAYTALRTITEAPL